MDKQEATQFTISQLSAGSSAASVSEELSRMLKAPPEITRRFVEQIIASHPEVLPKRSISPDTNMPDWMQPLGLEYPAEPEPDPVYTDTYSGMNSDLPPNLQSLVSGQVENLNSPAHEPFEAIDHPLAVDLPKQAPLITPDQGIGKSSEENLSQNLDMEALAEYVLEQLKKRRRNNDIVETVCQSTGWHWNKSQRFVARVKTKNHDQLQSGQNRVTIIIGVAIIIVGLVISLAGASTIADYAKLAAFARTNPSALFEVSPQMLFLALAATITGIGMIIGGGYGVARALVNH